MSRAERWVPPLAKKGRRCSGGNSCAEAERSYGAGWGGGWGERAALQFIVQIGTFFSPSFYFKKFHTT